MQKVKTLIERKLKFDQQYIYLELIRGSIESGQVTTCENCGKLITNMVKLANKQTKHIHYIGTDCAETLSKAKCLYNNGNQTDFYIDIYVYNRVSKFVTELNKGKKYEGDFLITVTNDKGKELNIFKAELQKFYPQYIIK